MSDVINDPGYGIPLTELKTRIHTVQYAALRAVNKALIALYGNIGKLIEERQDTEDWGARALDRVLTRLSTRTNGVLNADRSRHTPRIRPNRRCGEFATQDHSFRIVCAGLADAGSDLDMNVVEREIPGPVGEYLKVHSALEFADIL